MILSPEVSGIQKTLAFFVFGGGALFNLRKILLKGDFSPSHSPFCLSAAAVDFVFLSPE